MTRAGASARFRQRKLSTKQTLQILHEDQIDRVDDDQQRNIPKVDTGVEKGEEIEHHLQAAISASQAAAVGGKVAQIYIPTPETNQSTIQYDQLYPSRFSQPATYIRFSSTVEECIGTQYCMNREDDVYLKIMNQKAWAQSPCSEDQFEQIMDFFEQFSRSRQPFAAVDNAAVIGLDDMMQAVEFHESVEEVARSFAKDIYVHWKNKRAKRGNKPLIPQLKGETGQETDDADPYVCFRRREVRQVRKTRGRDAQSIEKLRKLRKELEDARQLVALVRQREMTKRELLVVEKAVFDQRTELKATKRKLGIKGDDDDLINQIKPPKKASIDQRPAQKSGPQLRLSLRPDGRGADSDLVSLQDTLAAKNDEIQKEIDRKTVEHRAWLNESVDLTALPLTPVSEDGYNHQFRTAIVEYIPTPPASVASSSPRRGDHHRHHTESPSPKDEDAIVIRYQSPPLEEDSRRLHSYRRRIGRGGRLMIDRRGFHLQSKEDVDPMLLDRFKYDQDDEDDEDDRTCTVNSLDTCNIQYRASILRSHWDAQAPRLVQTDTPKSAST